MTTIKDWLKKKPRSPWFVDHDSLVETELVRLLTLNIDRVTRQEVSLFGNQYAKEVKSDLTWQNPGVYTMKAHVSSPAIYEMYSFLCIVAYLCILYTLFKTCGRGHDWLANEEIEQ